MNVYVWHDGSGVWEKRLRRAGLGGGASLPAEAGGVLVCWREDAGPGGAGGSPSGGFRRVLNDPARSADWRDERRLRRKLALHGVRYEPAGTRGGAGGGRLWLAGAGRDRWLVHVFDMAAIGLRPLCAGGGEEEGGLPPNRLARLARFAVRAVYGAGLDFGTAVIRLEGARQAVLERLDPAPAGDGDWPPWRDALLKLAAEAGRRARGDVQPVLGMDPEFVLLNESGKVVPASRFFAMRGEVGCDNATVPGRAGVHPLAELRPAPSGEPEALIRSLRRTMWTAAVRIGDPALTWRAGGMPVPGLPLGGHIHLSGVGLTAALVRALDNYMALPLLLLEDETAARRRRRYGKPGDVRRKSHGGFEYRTLPSLIVSPRLTKGAVALAKLIAENYEMLKERPLDEPELLAAFTAGDKKRLAPAARRLWSQVAALDGYAALARFLDPLGEWLHAGKAWNGDTDFRRAWRIPPFRGTGDPVRNGCAQPATPAANFCYNRGTERETNVREEPG